MTYIPNVRTKKDELSACFGKDRDNPYYEAYMDESGKSEVLGYDWAVECVRTFFDNLDDYEYGEVERKAAMRIKEDLMDSLEIDRNETVVSIIDNMDENAYEANVMAAKDLEDENGSKDETR